VLNSFRQIGGALGIAVMGAILASYLHASAPSALEKQQYVDGLHAALLVSACIVFAGAIVAISLVRMSPAAEKSHVEAIPA
jgi:hypothetical protein